MLGIVYILETPEIFHHDIITMTSSQVDVINVTSSQITLVIWFNAPNLGMKIEMSNIWPLFDIQWPLTPCVVSDIFDMLNIAKIFH